jgi:hypothetical protein
MARTQVAAKKKPAAPPPVHQGAMPVDVRNAIAEVTFHPTAAPATTTKWGITIDVDWTTLEITAAQNAYSMLQREYEKAGRILNSRTTRHELGQFYCFMAGSPGACKIGVAHTGRPCFIDNARKAPKGGYKDPRTDQVTPEGLFVPVEICSERCYQLYNALLIAERRERENPEAHG